MSENLRKAFFPFTRPRSFDTEIRDTLCNPAMNSPIDHLLYSAEKQTVNNEELREDLLLHGDLVFSFLPLPPVFAGETPAFLLQQVSC